MASIHKDPRGKSPYWYCAFYSPDGKRRFKSTKCSQQGKALKICLGWEKAALAGRAKTLTEAQARRVLSDILEEVTGQQIQFYTCRSWFAEWIKNREATASKNTMLRYRQVTRDFLDHLGTRADLTLGAVTPTDIRDFRDKLKKEGRTTTTVNNVVKKVLNVPFAAALKLGFISMNPIAGVDSYRSDGNPKKHPFTSEQLGQLLRAAMGTEWEGMILAGYYTGLRLSNLAKLRWEQVDLDTKTIRLQTVKTNTWVTVPLHLDLLKWLKTQTQGIGKAGVFPGLMDCAAGGAGGLSAQFRKLFKSTEVKVVVTPGEGKVGRQRFDLSFHSLRHSFISNLANADISLDVRKKLVGHASDEVHELYTHHDAKVLQKAVASIPSIYRAG